MARQEGVSYLTMGNRTKTMSVSGYPISRNPGQTPGTGAQNLDYVFPAGLFSASGMGIRVTTAVIMVANANAKSLTLQIGTNVTPFVGNNVFTRTVGATDTVARFDSIVLRAATSTTAVVALGTRTGVDGGTLALDAESTFTISGNLDFTKEVLLRYTTNATTVATDINTRVYTIEFIPGDGSEIV